MKRIAFLTVIVSFVMVPFLVSGETWQIDPDHSSFQFRVSHMTVSNVKGGFSKSSGVVVIDGNNISNLSVEVKIDAASVDTGHAKRDEHLRGEDFFHVAKYPTITFVSKKVTKGNDDRVQVVGDLTIKSVTKEVSVDVQGPTPEIKDPWGNIRRGATGTAKINRKDFGILWNKVLDNGGLVVGDDVYISIEVELIRK
jgi:polyisoprenoid-binding protein YceI